MKIDFGQWERKETDAGQVRGRHYREWRQEIAELKKARRFSDALQLLAECIEATERADRVSGNGCPDRWFYEQSAMIYRRQRDFHAEVAVLERYLRAASEATRARQDVLSGRYQKAWFRLHGTSDAPVPAPAVPTNGLAQLLAAERATEKRKAEAVARRFLDGAVLANDHEEAVRRSRAGLPAFLLDRDLWRREALQLAGGSAEAVAVVDALVSRADRWGVLDPDLDLVRRVFTDQQPYSVVDLRTGEEVRTSFGTTRIELWASAQTGVDLRIVDGITSKLSAGRGSMIAFWQIPGDIMNGKGELRTLSS